MTVMLPPPSTAVDDLLPTLRAQGFAVLDAAGVGAWLGLAPQALAALQPAWDDLPADEYLKDGGRYRRRRHGCYRIDAAGSLAAVPHRAHYQPLEYNALHGGMRRWFAPLTPALTEQPAWPRLLMGVAQLASALRGPRTWYLEAHPFRIDTTGGIGRPTPEGAHRDGVDLVAVFLVRRHAIKGGESRVFEADGPRGQRFTLVEPWSALLLDDERVIHETTPIQPLREGEPGWRDTLVLTVRSGGFLGDEEGAG
ncbi:MAG: 2OG-Fe dioxygenase family protein [Tepidimonas sp.]|uniref:2OG-Fe dioxygenase family protein n=1 Tax=Tepidimonas sp. TaxID=2002775 RepID=UPI00298EF8C3|nr:2OG-Fe dioxygenase family protein [Tepidimonas sp.]MCS6810315.1 2OG-Fe dioxygenase family protein [Tepidimonas sp.]MCX7742358.1 2OG-Fe dioxygenase family protein [Tepidimonas sp.]MDW8336544.1 2OG-Fe dioxygenase family protein [Tepidimonas sp.]